MSWILNQNLKFWVYFLGQKNIKDLPSSSLGWGKFISATSSKDFGCYTWTSLAAICTLQ